MLHSPGQPGAGAVSHKGAQPVQPLRQLSSGNDSIHELAPVSELDLAKSECARLRRAVADALGDGWGSCPSTSLDLHAKGSRTD